MKRRITISLMAFSLAIGLALWRQSEHRVKANAAAPSVAGTFAHPSNFKASTALVDITPSNNGFPRMFLAGFGDRDQPATGALPGEPLLTARALAIRDGNCADNIKVIITADILGFTRQLRRQILTEAAHRYGLSRQNLLLAASHTHNGPVLTDNLDPKVTYPGLSADGLVTSPDLLIIDSYTDWLKNAVVNLIGTAINGLRTAPPVTLSYRVGTADLGFNRAGIGNEDHDVPVLAVKSADDNSLVAVVFGFACHPITTGFTARYYYHPDFPGVARKILERDNGGMAFFIQGTAGDIDPDRNVAPFVENQGGQLASAVERVLTGGGLQPVTGPILTESRDLSLPLNIDPNDTGHQGLKAKYVTLQMSGGVTARHANQMVAQIDAGKLPEAEPWPAQAWHFGATNSLALAALGGEPVSGYSIYFKNQFSSQLSNKLWVAGYCNEVPGYIPSNQVWDLPSMGPRTYEAGWISDPLVATGTSQMYYGWPAPLKRGNSDRGGAVKGVEELVIENITSMIRNLPQPQPDTRPPTLTLKPSISLWPPNHKYQTVTVARMVAGVSDGCATGLSVNNVVIEKATSDEPEDDPSGGDGNTTNDIVIAGDCKSVQLRSERDGSKNGRVYSITLRVRDASGNVTRKDFKVTVPKSQGSGPAIQDAPTYTVTSSCP